MGGRGSGSNMASSSSMSGRGDSSPITQFMAKANQDPMINENIPMNRQQVKDYFDLIGYDKYNDEMLNMSAGMYKDQLDSFSDVKRARINAEKLPKTGDSYMDKSSNVKDYYMATMASPGDSRAIMNKYWATTPGKIDLANFMRGEVDAGLTGSEMKSVIDSVKRSRR